MVLSTLYNDQFHTHFLLFIEDGDHDGPEGLAPFVHTVSRMPCERSEYDVNIDFTSEGSRICAYPLMPLPTDSTAPA